MIKVANFHKSAVHVYYMEKDRLILITVRNEVAKVMFLQACVCPQWGEYLTRYTPPTRYPRDQVHPPVPGIPPRTRYTPQTRYTPRPGTPLPRPGTPPGTRYTPPGPGTPPPGPGTPPNQVHPLLGPGTPQTRYTPRGPGTPPPRDTATAADGTHPTGMHSCYIIFLGGGSVNRRAEESANLSSR